MDNFTKASFCVAALVGCFILVTYDECDHWRLHSKLFGYKKYGIDHDEWSMNHILNLSKAC